MIAEISLHPIAVEHQKADTEHPDFPYEDRKYEVSNGDTKLEYWSWLSHQLEGENDDAEYLSMPQPFDPFNL
jgi:hypothetical protein